MKQDIDTINTHVYQGNVIKRELDRNLDVHEGNTIVPLQNEFAITSASSEHPYIGTTGLSTCIAVTFYDPMSQTGAVAHLDTKSDLSSLEMIIGRFPKFRRLHVTINGGDITEESQAKAEKIFSFLSERPEISIKAVHVNNAEHPRMLVMDTKTGNIYEHEPPHDLAYGMERSFLTGFSKLQKSVTTRPMVEITQKGKEVRPLSHVLLSEKSIELFSNLKNGEESNIIPTLGNILKLLYIPDERIINAVQNFDEKSARQALSSNEKNLQLISTPMDTKKDTTYKADLVLDVVKDLTGKKRTKVFSLSKNLEQTLRDIMDVGKHTPLRDITEPHFEQLFNQAKSKDSDKTFAQAKEAYRELALHKKNERHK